MSILYDLGLGGSAFRKEQAKYLSVPLWERAGDALEEFCTSRNVFSMVSGGAAGIDSLLYRLVRNGVVTLALVIAPGEIIVPDEDDKEEYAYFTAEDEDGKRIAYERDVKAANFYHNEFREKTGIDLMGELVDAIVNHGVKYQNGYSFQRRNELVAESSQNVVSMTFGEEASGGTRHMVRHHVRQGRGTQTNIDLFPFVEETK